MIKKYGLTIEEYEEKYKQQDGKCAICEIQPLERLNIDHCHETGKVRDLLCRNCNHALGNVNDDPDLLRRLISYLEKHGA